MTFPTKQRLGTPATWWAATAICLALLSGCGPQTPPRDGGAPDEAAPSGRTRPDDPQAANGDSDAAATPDEATSTDETNPANETNPGDNINSGGDSSSGVSGPAPEITLQIVDADGYSRVIEKYRGKVVLVDFWATWCGHCVEQFPHTVKLHNEFGDQGLAVVSFSVDDLADEADVRAKLSELGAEFDNLLSQYDDSVGTLKELGVDGGIPFYRLYDRKGQLRYSLGETDPDNPLQPEEIEQRVKELLAEEA